MYKLLMVVLSVLPLFSGCGALIPVGSERPQKLVDKSVLDSMIGQDDQTVLLALGRPDLAFGNEKISYFTYGALGKMYQLLFIIPIPTGMEIDPEGELYCVLLEFDEKNIFRRYRMKHHSSMVTKTHGSGVISYKIYPSDCASIFFSQKELDTFTLREFEE